MAVIVGTAGNDTISDVSSPIGVFTSEDLDKVSGLAGNDIISTLGGIDLILGGIGDDKIGAQNFDIVIP